MRKAMIITALAGLLATGAVMPVLAQNAETLPGPCPAPEFATQPTQTAPDAFVVTVGETEVAMANSPVGLGAEILTPLRESLAAIGVEDYNYMAATNQVTFTHNGRRVVLNLTSNEATINGQRVALTVPIENISGEAYVPASFISSLDPSFQVSRVRVAGFRGLPGMPPSAGVNTFTFAGQPHTYTAPTFYMGEDLMVPLGESLSVMGVTLPSYQPGDLQVSFQYNGRTVLMNIGSGHAYVDNQSYVLDKPVDVRNNIVYVPASFLRCLEPQFNIAGLRAPVAGAMMEQPIREQAMPIGK